MINQTPHIDKFDTIIASCKELFLKKMSDYGTSWILFRLESLFDQLWIKAKRIRTLEELKDQKLIPEGRESEYVGIINYSLMALMKICYDQQLPNPEKVLSNGEMPEIAQEKMSQLYDEITSRIRILFIKKNHDYGQAWRDMEICSITDQILVRILRIKTILKNDRNLMASEDLDAQLMDIINYAIFALIKYEDYSKPVNEIDLYKGCRFCNPLEEERILVRRKNFYVMLSLGPLVEGYCLIIPKAHITTFGKLPSNLFNEFLDLKEKVTAILKKVYKTDFVLCYEHGNIATSIGLPPNDNHAHIHILPVPKSISSLMVKEIEDDLKKFPIKYYSFTDFWEDYHEHHSDEPYIFIEKDNQTIVFYLLDNTPRSQYLRYLVAKILGLDEKLVDWKSHPNWERILGSRLELLPHFILEREENDKVKK
ncbi:hypothetical protein MSKOL_0168 [Methanosarcina sp. Kolksee]|uniref:nucleotide modification associated domain-containing protein n=1 Tax=Methanosarcina sp. Kolksee TaxID=1434099 RepID=UPI0006155701|nr:nucleotide modification associated domain-containing protein [Methanosarcina sp. Kolksee]AKB45945.1 hypothetical protein MSKOL_0168 [Methanosarcina sp. Kolksee]